MKTQGKDAIGSLASSWARDEETYVKSLTPEPESETFPGGCE